MAAYPPPSKRRLAAAALNIALRLPPEIQKDIRIDLLIRKVFPKRYFKSPDLKTSETA